MAFRNDTGHARPWPRKALLATAAAVIVGGGLLGGGVVAGTGATAFADPVTVQPVQAPSFADLVAKVAPAVVSIRVNEKAQVANSDQLVDPNDNGSPFQGLPNLPFGQFFNFGPNGQDQTPNGPQAGASVALGSGFFISDDGYVVTNNHVVDNGSAFTVIANNGTEYKAKLVGKDPQTDLAVLKVDGGGHKFTYVDWASAPPRVGDWVVAVGNPYGLGGTVTAGIVSAEDRQIDSNPYDDYLQIDAPVNRGNSGGPTFNTSGQVVGINTAIFSPSGGSVGIGFDIPASVAKPVIAALENHQSITRGWLGVQIQPLTQDLADGLNLSDTSGALVADAQSDTPASAAGVKAGDVIVSVDGKAVHNPRDLAAMIGGDQPNTTVDLGVWRNGMKQDINVKLGTAPGSNQAASAQGSGSAAGKSELSSLGMTIVPSGDGVAIASIDPNGAAGGAGLSPGDRILSVGNTMVASTEDVTKAVQAAKQDGMKDVLMRVQSGQHAEFVAIPLG